MDFCCCSCWKKKWGRANAKKGPGEAKTETQLVNVWKAKRRSQENSAKLGKRANGLGIGSGRRQPVYPANDGHMPASGKKRRLWLEWPAEGEKGWKIGRQGAKGKPQHTRLLISKDIGVEDEAPAKVCPYPHPFAAPDQTQFTRKTFAEQSE